METFTFWVLSSVAIAGAASMVLQKNPLSSALSLTMSLVAVAGLFATLSADFLFVIQLLVYAGAVMVLVIYVIMLLNLRDRDMRLLGVSKPRAFTAGLVGILLVGLLARAGSPTGAGEAVELEAGFGGVEAIAGMIFTDYIYSFEVISVLLLAAMVGAVVLAMKKF